MSFIIDDRILSTCFTLGNWPLSCVLFKNNADYPWFILVPRIADIQEIEQLSQSSRHMLVDEISQLSAIIQAEFKPDKINVGALGNMVPQLHIHMVARFTHDKLWPHGVWQADLTTTPYDESQLKQQLDHLRGQISDSFILR